MTNARKVDATPLNPPDLPAEQLAREIAGQEVQYDDKDAVLREAFRVLKPGGRFAVSDVVVRGDVPPDVRRSMELWVGCIAGALEETDYAAKLKAAGFIDVDVEPWRIYQLDDARAFLAEGGVDVDRIAPEVEGRFASAFVRARKPEARTCCGPSCCG